MATITYPFTEDDSTKAFQEWGANCGPNALAFACNVHINDIRGKIPGFDEKRYTSPTMMAAGIENMKRRFNNYLAHPNVLKSQMTAGSLCLVRVQWTGPWTAPGANPKWAYRQTHWICAWKPEEGISKGVRTVFDVNGGINTIEGWENTIVPLLTSQIPKADGGWYPTHVWRLV